MLAYATPPRFPEPSFPRVLSLSWAALQKETATSSRALDVVSTTAIEISTVRMSDYSMSESEYDDLQRQIAKADGANRSEARGIEMTTIAELSPSASPALPPRQTQHGSNNPMRLMARSAAAKDVETTPRSEEVLE